MSIEILSYLTGLLLLLWFAPPLLFLAVFLALCLVLSNWQDAAPEPPLVSLLQRQVIEPAREQNGYFLRRDDLLVWRQVVALQLDMLESGLGVAEVVDQALLEGRLAHPFSGQSPDWNLKSRHLVYGARPERREGMALEIRL